MAVIFMPLLDRKKLAVRVRDFSTLGWNGQLFAGVESCDRFAILWQQEHRKLPTCKKTNGSANCQSAYLRPIREVPQRHEVHKYRDCQVATHRESDEPDRHGNHLPA
jgi:hypothetical protein